MINEMMDRIAASETGLAAFIVDNELRLVFANTVHSNYWIRKGTYKHIGTFYKNMHMGTIEKKLYKAIQDCA